MSSPILSLLGLAKKAGRLEIGEEPVGAAARARQAKLILVAADAAENSRRRAAHFAETGNVPWIGVPFTKAELGQMMGRGSCAMAALTDAGFAASLCAKLAAADPEQYGDAAQALDAKAQKVYQRQKEQRIHEKRLREGKYKPWSPPAKQKAEAAPPKAGKSPGKPSAPRVVPKGKIVVKGKLPHGPKPS